MAKPKTVPTVAQNAAQAASEAHKKAKDAVEKNDNPMTQAALKKATEALASARNIKNREAFVRLINSRLAVFTQSAANVAKMANPKSYVYDSNDISAIRTVIADAAASVTKTFEASLSLKEPGKKATKVFIS